jgi:hypothetical protein
MVAVSLALERVVGPRLQQGGVRDVITKWPTPTAPRQAGKSRIRNTIKNDHHDSQTKSPPRDGRHLMPRS